MIKSIHAAARHFRYLVVFLLWALLLVSVLFLLLLYPLPVTVSLLRFRRLIATHRGRHDDRFDVLITREFLESRQIGFDHRLPLRKRRLDLAAQYFIPRDCRSRGG